MKIRTSYYTSGKTTDDGEDAEGTTNSFDGTKDFDFEDMAVAKKIDGVVGEYQDQYDIFISWEVSEDKVWYELDVSDYDSKMEMGGLCKRLLAGVEAVL
jgi:hypothetical protein